MGVNLQKGGNVNLSKAVANLTQIRIGLGWDVRATAGTDFDLDASAFLLKAGDKVGKDADFIFYGKLTSDDGSVKHQGDNKTGAGAGDDESIIVDLSKVPADIQKIAVTVTIHEADTRKQSFGQVSNAFIRIVNEGGDKSEVARYDLTEDASLETAMIFGEVYRHNGEWKFRAVGQGFKGGLKALCQNFGVNVG